MKVRIQNAMTLFPDAVTALQAVNQAAEKGGIPFKTRELMHLRASQINGCGFCLDFHRQLAERAGETDERLFTVAGWRHTPYFTGAERAALALTEAVTRLADRPDPVPDEVWNEAARHYDERGLAALLLHISLINVFNRLNVASAQEAGSFQLPAQAAK